MRAPYAVFLIILLKMSSTFNLEDLHIVVYVLDFLGEGSNRMCCRNESMGFITRFLFTYFVSLLIPSLK